MTSQHQSADMGLGKGGGDAQTLLEGPSADST